MLNFLLQVGWKEQAPKHSGSELNECLANSERLVHSKFNIGPVSPQMAPFNLQIAPVILKL
jgi:hypothetical protein